MNCERAMSLVHYYADDELDPLSAAEFERHLEHCVECVSAIETIHSLRSSIQRAQFRHRAPETLRKKLLVDSGIASGGGRKQFHARRTWLAVAAAVVLCAVAGWQILGLSNAGRTRLALAAELVDAHLRSLEPGHLTDVLSSDQHTVKPWFAGKLDFSPPVRDFAAQGFPLVGGRLDVVQGRSSAALVYGRRKHIVSLFVWPSRTGAHTSYAGSQQGYQWLEWNYNGMEFWAVSDAAASELINLRWLISGPFHVMLAPAPARDPHAKDSPQIRR